MFQKWLSRPTETVSGKIGNVIAAFSLNVIWIIFIVAVLSAVMPWMKPLGFAMPKRMPTPNYIFFTIIMAPLWEELAFRVAPYKIARWFESLMSKVDQILYKERAVKYGTAKFTLMLQVILMAIIIFGWGHGNGTISLLVQGMGGLFLSIVYIKNNYSYWSSVALHAMWNTFVLFLI
jgi:hypothetical protein